ncbi:MAG: hypothetical protein C4289_14030, partial [Chloroflexota bacterium]
MPGTGNQQRGARQDRINQHPRRGLAGPEHTYTKRATVERIHRRGHDLLRRPVEFEVAAHNAMLVDQQLIAGPGGQLPVHRE